MRVLSEDSLLDKAQQRQLFRLSNVSSKLTRTDAERLDALAKRRGLQRGELIRQLILDELARDADAPRGSAELVEIVGIRLMLTNLLKPLATGKTITPELYAEIGAEVKKHKWAVAIEARQEAERG